MRQVSQDLKVHADTSHQGGEEAIHPSFRFPGWRKFLPVLLPYILLVATGLHGIDYGFHVDEKAKNTKWLATMVRTETLLPEDYIYPGMIYWIGLGSLLPETASLAWYHPEEGRAVYLTSVVNSDDFIFRLRGVVLCIASLAVVWVYTIVLLWRGSWIEALIASCILAFSWEFAYHARFFATDCLVVQFASLTLLLLLAALFRRSLWLLFAGAVVAGMTTSTKYPAGLLLLPVFLTAYWIWKDKKFSGNRFVFYIKLYLAFCLGYLVITPGTLLRPTYFLHSIHYAKAVYGDGWYNYTVDGFGDHIWRMLCYLSSVVFSPFPVIAWSIFALALVGVYQMARDEWRTFTVFIIFPFFYFLYFGTQMAMLVRNTLVLTPFLAILAGHGAMKLIEIARQGTSQKKGDASSSTWVAFILKFAIFLGLAANVGWLVYAAETVALRSGKGTHRQTEPYEVLYEKYKEPFLGEAADYVKSHPEQRITVSPRLREAMIGSGLVEPGYDWIEPDEAEFALFLHREGINRRRWSTDISDLFLRCFGPNEVNLNSYPSWQGDDRILMMRADLAEKEGQIGRVWGSAYGRVFPPLKKTHKPGEARSK